MHIYIVTDKMKVAINVTHFNGLIYIVKKIPEQTPHRWEHVCKFMKEMEIDNSQVLHLTIGDGRKVVNFVCTQQMCRNAWSIIQNNHSNVITDYNEILESRQSSHGIQTVILLPPSKACVECGCPIRMRNRPSLPVVYTETGPYLGAMYNGQCETCRITYWYSYMEKSEGDTIFYDLDEQNRQFFHITSSTVFSVKYLQDVTLNMVFSGVSFESRAKVYNAEHSDRIEKCTSSSAKLPHRSTADISEQRISEVRRDCFSTNAFYKGIAT